MIKVTIVKPEARTVAWDAKPGREAGSMLTQEAWFHLVDREGNTEFAPVKSEVVLDRARDGQPAQLPYPRGEYTLHPSAVYLDRNGRLAISPRLTPLAKRPA